MIRPTEVQLLNLFRVSFMVGRLSRVGQIGLLLYCHAIMRVPGLVGMQYSDLVRSVRFAYVPT